jgi:hypothetical protein
MYSEIIENTFRTINQLLTAGIAITAFSLLIYALTFNLRDRVARSFAIIMMCVVIVFVGDALGSVADTPEQVEFWLKFQWLGIVFLPAAYLHLSDAILATTGKPSRGRRRLFVRLSYLISLIFLLALPFGVLVGPLSLNNTSLPHLQRTWVTLGFTGLYVLAMAISWVNFWRAYKRTTAATSQRRMRYLIAGALAPALGSYPYLLFGSNFASQHSLIFWMVVTIINFLVSVLLVLMAYSVAFFGVSWPDRIVKRRLFKWILRGPITACSVLAFTTLLNRLGQWLDIDVSGILPVVMVASILIIEHLITLFVPGMERWLFGRDRKDMEIIQTLEERLLTSGDLRQFLEAILAAVCDRIQVPHAFIATLNTLGLEMFVTIGGDPQLNDENLPSTLLKVVNQNGNSEEMFTWKNYWLLPLFDQEQEHDELLGLLGVMQLPEQILDVEQLEALAILSERAALALTDRRRQEQVFTSLEALTPEMEMIQRLRAAARYDGTEVLTTPLTPVEERNLVQWVKDALTHYWGGPKLTESPLMELQVVRQSIEKNQETPANALRSILRQAIDRTRPEGERRFTGEWILYNILEMKFLEGKKVREIALRLAMSEADLYRKQRVAIDAVAQAIVEMEKHARQENLPALESEPHSIMS